MTQGVANTPQFLTFTVDSHLAINISPPTACQTTLCRVHVVSINITFFKRFFNLFAFAIWKHRIVVNLKKIDIETHNLLPNVRE